MPRNTKPEPNRVRGYSEARCDVVSIDKEHVTFLLPETGEKAVLPYNPKEWLHLWAGFREIKTGE